MARAEKSGAAHVCGKGHVSSMWEPLRPLGASGLMLCGAQIPALIDAHDPGDRVPQEGKAGCTGGQEVKLTCHLLGGRQAPWL